MVVFKNLSSQAMGIRSASSFSPHHSYARAWARLPLTEKNLFRTTDLNRLVSRTANEYIFLMSRLSMMLGSTGSSSCVSGGRRTP